MTAPEQPTTPPTLKQQALAALKSFHIHPIISDGRVINEQLMEKYHIILRAIEALPDDC